MLDWQNQIQKRWKGKRLTVSSSFLFKACISSTIRLTSDKIICSGTFFKASFLSWAYWSKIRDTTMQLRLMGRCTNYKFRSQKMLQRNRKNEYQETKNCHYIMLNFENPDSDINKQVWQLFFFFFGASITLKNFHILTRFRCKILSAVYESLSLRWYDWRIKTRTSGFLYYMLEDSI